MTYESNNIMLALESPEHREILKAGLKQNDYWFIEAHSCDECISLLKTRCPDILILDGGFLDIIPRVKEMDRNCYILVSGFGEGFSVGDALDAGADDCLVEISHPELLQLRLDQIIQTRRATMAQSTRVSFQQYMEYIPAAIAMFDTDMRYLAVSRRWLEDYNLGNQNVIGKTHYEIFPEIPDRWKQIHRRCLAGAVECCEEDAFLRIDGHIDWLRWEIHPWKQNDGEIGGIIMFTEVITERKQTAEALDHYRTQLETLVDHRTAELEEQIIEKRRTERALRESESKYRILFESAADAIVLTDINGNQLFCNSVFYTRLGFKPEDDITTLDYIGRVHPDDVKKIETDLYSVVVENGVATGELRIRHKDGQWVQFYVKTMMIKDEEENPQSIISIMRDITQFREITEALEDTEQRFRTILDTAPVSIVEIDHEGRILSINASGYTMMGFADGVDVVGESFLNLVSEGDRSNVLDLLKAAAMGANSPCEFTLIDSLHPALFSMDFIPIRNAAGDVIKVMGIGQDVTDRKLSEITRGKLASELAAKDAEFEQFTYNVSHNLQSPLVTIIGFLEYLKDSIEHDNRERMNKDIAYISDAVDQLQSLASELVDFSRVNRFFSPVNNVPLGSIVQHVIASMQAELNAKQIEVDVAPNLPEVYGDPAQLNRLFRNLISNAIRFDGSGKDRHIEIGIRHDNGVPVYYMKQAGTKTRSQSSRKPFVFFEGTNDRSDTAKVGLAIIKRIIEAHDGRIWVESNHEGASDMLCFTIGDMEIAG